MQIERIANIAFDRIFGRILRQVLAVMAIAFFVVVAIYHFTMAGTLSLETQYGVLHAQLIVGAVYAALAAVTFGIFRATRYRAAPASPPIVAGPAATQLAVLIEAAMLGYATGKKKERAS